MEKHNLKDVIEYSDAKPLPRVLSNQPGYRLVLLNLRSGQRIPEHATREMVTIYAITGHITFHAGHEATELREREVIRIDPGVPHQLEAHADSSLLVVAAGDPPQSSPETVLDLRATPRPQRHPLVFAAFDALLPGQEFLLINDHDPIPLRRQLETMRPGQVGWEYIERIPDSFRIRVSRTGVPDIKSRVSDSPFQTL